MRDDRTVQVLIADRQPLFRDALRVVLDGHEDFTVVAEAAEGMLAVSEASRTKPDVALIDADLPNCHGLRAAALIGEQVEGCRTLVLSDKEDDDTLLEALEAGATGYLTKASPIAELIEAARRVAAGETIVPPRMLGTLLARLIQRRRDHEGAIRQLAGLTRREREVLFLLAQGADNAGIAQPLVISPETARTHVQNVLTKLGVHSRLEAAAFVVNNGLMGEVAGVQA